MSQEIIHPAAAAVTMPLPEPVTTRVATEADLPWIDAMQKTAGRALGFFPAKQLAEYVRGGWVIVAEEGSGFGVQGSEQTSEAPPGRPATPPPLNPELRTP